MFKPSKRRITSFFSTLFQRRHHRSDGASRRARSIMQQTDLSSDVTLVSSLSCHWVDIPKHLDSDDLFHQHHDVVRDHEFYIDSMGNETGFLVLRVQNTLFRVHRFVLCRDDSSFSTLFGPKAGFSGVSLPFYLSGVTVDQFRDLLRVLYSLPVDLPTSDIDETSVSKLPRLLNVAELARKYGFTAFELWAIEHIYLIIKAGFLIPSHSTTSPYSPSAEDHVSKLDLDNTLSRILTISVQGNHAHVLDILVPKLINRLLWYGYHPGKELLQTVERLSTANGRLRTLFGILYYRMLIDLPHSEPNDGSEASAPLQPRFPASMHLERRMRILSAYHGLSKIWSKLCMTPPLPSAEESSAADSTTLIESAISVSSPPPGSESTTVPNPHARCIDAWTQLWINATEEVASRPDHSPADVLGNLKRIMVMLRKTMADSPAMCVECSLGGLEALATLRDEVILCLPRMFEYCH